MVAQAVIIKVLIALASLTVATVTATPIEPDTSNGLSSRSDPSDLNTLIVIGLHDPKYYHFNEYIGIKEENETRQKMIKQQPLSMAKNWGDSQEQETRSFFWFAEKNPVYKKDGPGTGCEVSLYFDNIKERAKAADKVHYAHDRYSDRANLTWAVPNAITPRCNPDVSPAENKDYPGDAVGYISTRPDTEEYYRSAIVTLGYLEGEGNGDADTTKAMQFDLKFTDDDIEGELNKEHKEFIDKLNELIKKDYTEIPNPYKFGKADASKWARTKKDSFYAVS